MKAFGFSENIEAFVEGRQKEGIHVALANYGWITNAHSSVNAVALFQFGSKYANNTHLTFPINFTSRLSTCNHGLRSFRTMPMLIQTFSDEVHGTEFLNYFLAREIFEKLRTFNPLRSRIAVHDMLTEAAMDAFFSYHLGWGEYHSGFGFPKDFTKFVSIVKINKSNLSLVSDNSNKHGAKWSCCSPQNIDAPGVLDFTLQTSGYTGLIAYLSRIFSNNGRVEVKMKQNGEWHKVSELVRYVADDERSPVESRYGFVISDGADQAVDPESVAALAQNPIFPPSR